MFLEKSTPESIERALLAQAEIVYPAERIPELLPRIRHLANMMAEIDKHRMDLREYPDPNHLHDRSAK